MNSVRDLFQPLHLENKYLDDFYITPFAKEFDFLRSEISKLPEYYSIEGVPENVLWDKITSWGYDFRDDVSPDILREVALRLVDYYKNRYTYPHVYNVLTYAGNPSYISGLFHDYSQSHIEEHSFSVNLAVYDIFRWDASFYDYLHVYEDFYKATRNIVKIESSQFGQSFEFLSDLNHDDLYYNEYKKSLQMELETLKPLGYKFHYINSVCALDEDNVLFSGVRLVDNPFQEGIVNTAYESDDALRVQYAVVNEVDDSFDSFPQDRTYDVRDVTVDESVPVVNYSVDNKEI